MSTRLALVNIRLLFNKSLLINDIIMTNLVSLLIGERWLTVGNCHYILNKAVTKNVSFINKHHIGKKTKNGSRVGASFKSLFQWKEI